MGDRASFIYLLTVRYVRSTADLRVRLLSVCPSPLSAVAPSASPVCTRWLVATAAALNTCQNRKHTDPRALVVVGTVRRPSSL